MKKAIVMLAAVLAIGAASAQNGIYRVTNQNELATATVKHNLRSSMTISYTEDEESEHAGMQPKEPDTAEAMNVLAEWLMMQTSNAEQRAITGAIPAQVFVDGNAVTLTDDRGDTIQSYAVKEIRGSESKREFVCADGTVIKLLNVGNDRYILQVPKMEKIELKKIK
ncbi:MAG: hypothetical protein J6X62_02000 [Bacteroidales bacterium]|nr:hypothetical protein [Bacteroidales bacterium]